MSKSCAPPLPPHSSPPQSRGKTPAADRVTSGMLMACNRELAWTMSRFAPECPLHWWDGDVGCRRQYSRSR